MFLSVLFFVAIAVAAAEDECLPGSDYFDGSCYTLGPPSMNFRDAKDDCEAYDGHLVEITSVEENDFVKSLLRRDTSDIDPGAYIGAQQSLGRNWKWQDSKADVTFSDWTTPGRRRVSRDSKCVSMRRDQDWGWVEQDCGVTQGMTSVCESCKLQVKCFNGSCYELLCRVSFARDIQQICDLSNGRVVEIDSQEENEFVQGFLSTASIPKSRIYGTANVWLGYGDDDKEGEFRWWSGNTVTGFSDWANSEPNNLGHAGRGENCVVMDASNNWKWNDVMCITENAVLCESEDVGGYPG